MRPVAERGYIIPAFNVGKVDYVDAARHLAKTLLQHHPDAKICLLTNEKYAAEPALFEYTQVVDSIDTLNPYANDWMVFHNTPFRQTIKLEADLMVASAVDHLWSMFEHRDVVISQGCRTFYDQPAENRRYRQVFDANNLPDVYNAVTYWRLSKTAQEFFALVKNIFEHWAEYRKLLKFPEDVPSTDVVYAMAAQIMGPEQVTLPPGLGPQIVHMKTGVNPFSARKWTDELIWEYNPMRVQTVAQWGFFHLHVKDWHNE